MILSINQVECKLHLDLLKVVKKSVKCVACGQHMHPYYWRTAFWKKYFINTCAQHFFTSCNWNCLSWFKQNGSRSEITPTMIYQEQQQPPPPTSKKEIKGRNGLIFTIAVKTLKKTCTEFPKSLKFTSIWLKQNYWHPKTRSIFFNIT